MPFNKPRHFTDNATTDDWKECAWCKGRCEVTADTPDWEMWECTVCHQYERRIVCGTWRHDGNEYCDDCLARMGREFPQGWRYYPGDTCKHGMYTGGSGIDWMCGYCENGE